MSVFVELVETMKEIPKVKITIYVFLSAFIAESVQLADRAGPELYPVMPGTNWLLCAPLLTAINDNVNVSAAGWSILLNDEWSFIAGIGRSAGNTTDSWDQQFSKNYTRYSFYASNHYFLQIEDVSKEDDGSIYRCRFVTWDGHPTLVYFKLQVLEPKEVPASFTSFSPDRVAVEGDPASIALSCTADGKPTPNITWTKVYDNGSDSDVLFTGEQFVLINNRNNAGTYRCKADNGIGSAMNQIIHVTIHFPASFTSFSPDQVAVESDPASIALFCTADGKPTSNITWTKVYDNGSDSDVLLTGEQFVLINNRNNAGTYCCKADNGIGSAMNQIIHVTIHFPASFTSFSPDQVAVESDPASIALFCTADGKPTSNITWTKVYDNGSDSDVLFTGEQFVLINNRNNAGTYRCKADNGIGSAMNQIIHVTILFPASFTSFSPDQVAVESDPASVTLFCTADGKPTSNITWTKVYDNGSDSDVLFTGEQFVLINNRNNAGTYCCKADNGIGSAMNQRIHVTIHFKPENVMLTVNYSNDVISVSCSAVGDPVVHTYLLFENDTLVSNSGGPIYIVWSKRASSGGVLVYRCEAYNTVGTANTAKTVTVNDGNPSHSGGETSTFCTVWIVVTAIIVVALSIVITCCHFRNVSCAVNPQLEMNYDGDDGVNHGSTTFNFNGPSKDEEDVGQDADVNLIPLSVRENNDNTGILPCCNSSL